MKWLLTIVAAIFLTTSATYGATIERSYQAVMHVHDSHAKPVLDRPHHVVGIGAFRGLATFGNGDVAIHRYDGWFDLANGSGKFHGYALWRFDDGSELRAAYDGSANRSSGNVFRVEARFHSFKGTGKFSGVSGKGSFKGRRFEPIEKGGSTLLNGTLTLNLPN